MQRILLIALALLLQFQYVTAQEAKPTKVDFDYVTRRMTFPALLQQLTKESTYSVVMPKKMTFHPTEYDVTSSVWNPVGAYIDIKARTQQVNPDFIFEITAGGAANIDTTPARYIKTKRYENNIPKDVSGLVRDYTCNFPCTLTIKTKNGATVRTIEIAGEKEVFTATLHKDFLSATQTQVNPFYSALSLSDYTSYNEKAIYKKIEEKVGAQVFSRMTRIIAHLYNSADSYKEVYGFGLVKPKDRVNDYSDLDNALAQYKTALDSMHTGNMEACRTLCQSAKTVFEKLIASNEPRIDKNVKDVLIYNLGHVNLLMQNFTEATRYYQLLLQSGWDESARMPYELKARIQQHETYYKLKTQLGI